MVNVNTIQPGTVFAWFMLLMVIRRIVMLIIAGIAGHNKPLPADRVPEDKVLKRGRVASSTSETAHGNFNVSVRVNKAITNDSENDTYFLILLLSTAVFSDDSNGNCVRTIVYGTIYLFFRIFYALAYIMALQPWRSIAYYFGLACTLACNLDLVITMSRRAN